MIDNIISNKKLLRIYSSVFVIIPVGIAYFFDVSDQLLIIGIILFLMLNYDEIKKRLILKPRSGESFIPFYYYYGVILIFLFSFNYVFSFLYENVSMVVHLYIIGITYFIIFQDWIVYFDNIPFKFINIPILRSETTTLGNTGFLIKKSFAIPVIVVLFYLISSQFFPLMLSFYSGNGLYHVVRLLLVFIFATILILIHNLFLEQHFWTSKTGIGEFAYNELPPVSNDIKSMEDYLSHIYKVAVPPKIFVDFLEKNTYDLIKNSDDIKFTSFHLQLVYAMNNWATNGRDLLQYYSLIIMSSFSRYLRFGHIPLHKRKIFYYYILSLYKMGAFKEQWKVNIEFEMSHMNFYAFRLFEAVFYPSQLSQVNKNWTDIFNGQIYRGVKGFNKFHEKIKNKPYLVTPRNSKERDVIDLTSQFLEIFIGENSRQTFKRGLNIKEKAMHIASGDPLSTFKTYKDKLEIVDTTFASFIEEEEEFELPEKMEREKIILRELGYTDHPTRTKYYRKIIFDVSSVLSIFIGILVLGVNIGLFILIKYFFGSGPVSAILFIQVILLVFLGIDINTDDSQTLHEKVKTEDKYFSIKINYSSNTFLIVYNVIIIIIVNTFIGL